MVPPVRTYSGARDARDARGVQPCAPTARCRRVEGAAGTLPPARTARESALASIPCFLARAIRSFDRAGEIRSPSAAESLAWRTETRLAIGLLFSSPRVCRTASSRYHTQVELTVAGMAESGVQMVVTSVPLQVQIYSGGRWEDDVRLPGKLGGGSVRSFHPARADLTSVPRRSKASRRPKHTHTTHPSSCITACTSVLLY